MSYILSNLCDQKSNTLDYNEIIVNFCERKLYPDRPEYINAISALYITGIGYYNLRKIAKKSVSLSLIHWCICINGIGSFYYHWTAWYLFRLIDEFTMIIPLWIGIVKIMHDLNYSTYWLGIISIYNILLLVFDVFPWFKYFAILFLIEMLLIIPLYNGVYIQYTQSQNIIIRKFAYFKNNGFKGIVICSISGITWGIAELNCNEYSVFGHAIWHIGMSTGLCNIIQYLNKHTELVKNLNKLE